MPAPRPAWSGHLRLSLVSCPVQLYTATSREGDVHFRMINEETGNRIRMIPTDPETGPVERTDIVKGYEIEKDHYIIMTPDEIAAVRLETTETLDIERFVDVEEIDRLYWDEPYYMTPDGKMAAEAFGVIREAMAASGKIALGRLVMHQRERLMALEPRGKGLVAWRLRSRDDVRDPADFFADIPRTRADPKMIAIAGQIIAQQEGPFEPDTFVDRYEDALRELIAHKAKGRKITAPPPTAPAPALDLMEALRRSLGGAPGGRRGRDAEPRKAPRKPARRRA